MRKQTTALFVTTMFALASGTAFAGQDKKAEAETAAPGTTQAMKGDSTGTPSGATATTAGDKGTADKSDKRKQVARNDPKCDESKVARESMPKDCFEKSGTGAAAVGSTQGQSGK